MRIAAVVLSYIGLAALCALAWMTPQVHLGAVAVIPLLVIAYYLPTPLAVLSALVAGIALGLIDHDVFAAAVHLHRPPAIIDALLLAFSMSTVVLVANRLRATAITNASLRHRLERARSEAHHDALTGIPNRAYFFERLTQEIANSRNDEQLGVLYCDLDGFKSVNDTDGHQAGDEVLRMAAERLTRAVRSYDFVARLGGDEFGVVAFRINGIAEAEQMAHKIESAFADPIKRAVRQYAIGISVGAALYPDDARDVDSLLQAADARMYRAKRRKRVASASV